VLEKRDEILVHARGASAEPLGLMIVEVASEMDVRENQQTLVLIIVPMPFYPTGQWGHAF
jgi:hypothetical protein